jgi:ferredoxin
MAMLVNNKNNERREVENGSPIKKAAEELGVPFSCEEGTCGTCLIDIRKGKDNLAELTPEEKDMGLDRDRRLACQCSIKSGEVVIDF